MIIRKKEVQDYVLTSTELLNDNQINNREKQNNLHEVGAVVSVETFFRFQNVSIS